MGPHDETLERKYICCSANKTLSYWWSNFLCSSFQKLVNTRPTIRLNKPSRHDNKFQTHISIYSTLCIWGIDAQWCHLSLNATSSHRSQIVQDIIEKSCLLWEINFKARALCFNNREKITQSRHQFEPDLWQYCSGIAHTKISGKATRLV